jgi:hypothetical protein
MNIGQLKSLAKQKAGAKKIAKALNRTPSLTTVKAAYAYVGCVAQHEGEIEGKGRDS